MHLGTRPHLKRHGLMPLLFEVQTVKHIGSLVDSTGIGHVQRGNASSRGLAEPHSW